MKKSIFTLLMIVVVISAYAGGILTNTNQSAQWVRMLSRNASTQIDAVYFNPAGLMKLDNGFHFALQNQMIKQTRTITTTRPGLNNKEFIGDVNAPIFPTAFLVYKLDGVAFSFGFGPNGGGGSASFDKGLPSFEAKVANPLLAKFPGYSVGINFEAQSIFYGLQLGVSWKMGDIVSGYAGARYMPSVNTYTGNIKDISIIVGGQSILASPYFTAAATSTAGAATSAGQLITAGAGNFTLAQVQAAGYISSAQRAQLEGGLQGLGLTSSQIAAMNITAVKGAFDQGTVTLSKGAADTKDVKVDVKATGTGWTPILGINIRPNENLNIGLKYEHKTKLTLTNETKTTDGYSDAGMSFLTDKAKVGSDIPGIIAAGIEYKFSEKFLTSLSFNEYLDKGVNWGNNIYGEKRDIDHNMWELALGFQYDVIENLALSCGYMRSQTGVSEQYQSDFSYNNSANTFGGGLQWNAAKWFTLDLGGLYSSYVPANKSFTGFKESYTKKNIIVALGVGFHF